MCVFYLLAGISKCYVSTTLPSAVTMATSTGFSSCAALKNVRLTYNAASLMGAAGPQRCNAAKTSSSCIPVPAVRLRTAEHSLCSAVLLSTLSSEDSEWLLVLATIFQYWINKMLVCVFVSVKGTLSDVKRHYCCFVSVFYIS